MRTRTRRMATAILAATTIAATGAVIIPAGHAAPAAAPAAKPWAWNAITTAAATCGPDGNKFTATITYTSEPLAEIPNTYTAAPATGAAVVSSTETVHRLVVSNPVGGTIDSITVTPRSASLLNAPSRLVATKTAWTLAAPDALVRSSPSVAVQVTYKRPGGSLAQCTVPGGVTLAVRDPQQRPTPSEAAGRIYAQALGMNLGKTAAVIAIAAGLIETGLSNATVGDAGTNGSGMSSVRGVFQQASYWPPTGTAWSGQAAPTSPFADYSAFTNANAWTANGWAANDPRMNVAQSANLFLLGIPSAGGSGGLEDNSRFYLLPTRDPAKVSDTVLTQILSEVIGWTIPASIAAPAIADARDACTKFQNKTLAVPSFTQPLTSMEAAANRPETKAVFDRK